MRRTVLFVKPIFKSYDSFYANLNYCPTFHFLISEDLNELNISIFKCLVIGNSHIKTKGIIIWKSRAVKGIKTHIFYEVLE